MKNWDPYKKYGVLSDIPGEEFPKKQPEGEVEPPVITDEILEDLFIIKDLHGDNQGRKFTDDEFKQIIETLVRETPGALQSLINLNDNMFGALIALDDATRI